MNEKYQIGQTVYFDYRGSNIKAEVIRVNQKTLTVIAPELKGRVRYSAVSTTPSNTQQMNELPNLIITEHKSQKDLEVLMEEVKSEFSHIFSSIFNENECKLLKNVRIAWGKQYTFRLLGSYYHSKEEINYGNRKHNFIRISRSLQIVPNFVVKKTLYHEILHIKFHGHGPEFRRYDHKYPRFEEADEYENILCKEIRIHGMSRIFKIPTTKKEVIIKKTKKELIIEKAKELNVFPHYMNEYFMDDYDLRFLELQIKKHTKI